MIDEQALRDRYFRDRMIRSQGAKWHAEDPGAPADTCRFCGKHWRRWSGSMLDGHAKCIVSEQFKHELVEICRDPQITYAQVAKILGVTLAVMRSWVSPTFSGRWESKG